MVDFNDTIEDIRKNGGFKPNKNDTSYYRTYTIADNKPLQTRVSNHGTWLWTWYGKDYDPSYAINFCIVFSENGEYDSNVSVDMDIKDENGNVVGEKQSFEVKQFVYNCQLLDINDAALINQKVQSIWQNKGFQDPLAGTPKHAKVMILRPNEEPEIITENKQYKLNTNMNKKTIRLTESDLHRIVKESVNRILREEFDFGKKTFYRVEDETYPNLTLAHKAAKEMVENGLKNQVRVYFVNEDGEEYCAGMWSIDGYSVPDNIPHVSWLAFGHRG